MRRYAAIFAGLSLLLSTSVAWASEGEVSKVLSQFLDKKGRQSLAPSLYERDAYQAYLRKTPTKRGAVRLVIEYRAKDLDWEKTKLRAELRGVVTNSIHTATFEIPIKKKTGWFGGWADVTISGDQYKKFGDLIAWRVTLWEGDKQLSEKYSFMWTGTPSPKP